jgi:hypothetical protein
MGPSIRVEYWRCLREHDGLVLFLLVEGHEHRPYVIEAQLVRDGDDVEAELTARGLLHESPAHVEVLIKTDGLAPGAYDVRVSFDGAHVGTFPCEVGQPAPA